MTTLPTPERREGDPRLVTLNDEVREMREAITGLAGRVQVLSDNLASVNEVSRAQIETDRKSADAIVAAGAALTAAQNTIPRGDLEKKFKSDALAIITALAVVKQRTVRAAFTSFLLSLLLLGFASFLVIEKTNADHNDAVSSCQQRVAISTQAVGAYTDLLKSPLIANDPAVSAFVMSARDVSLKAEKVVCS